jgi:hypothetical protein
MKTSTVLVLVGFAMVVALPICVLGASYHFEPNPVGEKLYTAHLLRRIFPGAIIATAALFAWLLHALRRKATQAGPTEGYLERTDGDHLGS